MQTFLIVVHVLVGLFMILCVLIQAKGGSNVAFGASSGSQSIFGASGAGNFLTKTTTACAVIFMITSLGLTYMAARKAGSSVLKDVPTTKASALPDASSPTQPAAPAASTPSTAPAAPAQPAPSKTP